MPENLTYVRWLSKLTHRGLFRIHPSLDRIRGVLSALGNPQDRFPSIHIAGTNGKGSVAASLESIFRKAGYRAGLYISPHLTDLSERIQVDRRRISRKAFCDHAARVAEAERLAGTTLTYFEFLTTLAFLALAAARPEMAIIETGMGGRWDATNVVRRPALSVITSIGLDHTEWLGKTERAIAGHKAGILKPDGWAISGVRGEPGRIIAQVARRRKTILLQIDKDFSARGVSVDWTRWRQSIAYRGLKGVERLWSIGLLGVHQIDNAAVVLTAVEVLRANGWNLPEPAVEAGLTQVVWPARFQRLSADPLVLLDGAHNPPALAKVLETLKASPWKESPKTWVMGVYRDKDFRQMTRMIAPQARRVIACSLPGHRGLPAQELHDAFMQEMSVNDVRVVRDPVRAVQAAVRTAAPGEVVIATGSLAFMGILLKSSRLFQAVDAATMGRIYA